MKQLLERYLVALLLLGFFLLSLLVPAHAYRAVATCPSATTFWTAGATSVDPAIDLQGNICTSPTDLPPGATLVTNSGTAQTATLAAAAAKTTYLCGFSARSNATAAVQGNLTVTGTTGGTLNYAHVTAVLGQMVPTEMTFYPCIPSSAVNTAIVVTAPAPGAGGVSSTTAWGYQR